MTRYHVNSAGEPGACRAKPGNCPLGGEHFDTAEEAQKSFESNQSNQTTKLLKKNSEVENDFDSNWVKKLNWELGGSRQAGIAQRLVEGKKIKPRDLEEVLHSATQARTSDKSSDVGRLYSFIEQERRKLGGESVIPTVKSFDPETETMFSNKNARSNPYTSGKAIRREAGAGDWALEQSEEYSKMSQHQDATDDERKKDSEYSAARHLDYLNSNSRLNAMLKEAKWLSENDQNYEKRMSPELRRELKRFNPRDDMFSTPVIGVKKVR